jgi:hypothetical protein
VKRTAKILKIRVLFIFLIFISTVGYSRSSDLFNRGFTGENGIVFPEINGWTLIQEYPVYYPESLWDYINGAADAYLSYLFEDLHIAEYKNQEGTIIKAEVYRHKSPEYSFGIYSIERTPEYDFQDYGTQGYAEESLVHYISGKYYVKVTTNSSGEEIQKAVVLVANRVAEMLGDPGPLPEPLKSFPETGKVIHSGKFISDNFLGHHFMSRVFTADYKDGDEDFMLFLMENDTGEECQKILEAYYTFTGQTVELKEGPHTITDKYNGTINLVWNGNKIWGILNSNDSAVIKKYLDLMGK